MNDRFSYGFLSGSLAGLLPLLVNFSSFTLGLTTVRWADFMGQFTLGRSPGTLAETIFVILALLGFQGVLGAVFALLIPVIESERLLFKGVVYGVGLWVLLFSLPYLMQLPDFQEVPLRTAVVNLFSASIWGLTLALILERLESRVS